MCIRDRYNDDKITYWMLNKNTYGDRIEITNVNRFYESIDYNVIEYYVDKCYYNNNNKLYVDKNNLCFNTINSKYYAIAYIK